MALEQMMIEEKSLEHDFSVQKSLKFAIRAMLVRPNFLHQINRLKSVFPIVARLKVIEP